MVSWLVLSPRPGAGEKSRGVGGLLTLSILSFSIDSSASLTMFSFVGEPAAKPPFHFVSMMNCEPALTLPSNVSLSP
jgi:hypothetical protein